MACNTTAGQVIVLMGSEQDDEVNAGIRSARLNILGFEGDLSLSEPLNITEVIRVFYTGVVIMTGTLFPLGSSQSLLFASLGNNYSSISISYPGEAV